MVVRSFANCTTIERGTHRVRDGEARRVERGHARGLEQRAHRQDVGHVAHTDGDVVGIVRDGLIKVKRACRESVAPLVERTRVDGLARGVDN